MFPAASPDPLNGQADSTDDLDLSALPAELQQLEQALRSLAPREDRIDRDRLMFEAGREAVTLASASPQAQRWFWPAATAAMTTVAASLAFLLVMRGEVEVLERVQIVEVEREPMPEPPSPEASPEPAPAEGPHQLASPRSTGNDRDLAWSWVAPDKPSRRGALVPPAGLDFRLFEHLITDHSTITVGADHEPPAEADDSVLSPRSLPRLLDRSA